MSNISCLISGTKVPTQTAKLPFIPILIELGINKDRVTAIGYGEEKPLVQDDENGLSEINRRVEFNILGENK